MSQREMVAGLGLMALLLTTIATSAQPTADCRRNSAQALSISYQIAGQNSKRFVDVINQEFRVLGLTRERFRECFPEGEVVLRKIEQCAASNNPACTFSSQEAAQANQETQKTTRASAMTCQEFSNALKAAIKGGGDQVATPRMDRIAFRNDTTVRYELDGIVGVTGDLACEKADELSGFDASISIPQDREDLERRIWRIENLTAAAICAATNPRAKMAACLKFSKATLIATADQFMKAVDRGEPSPFAKKNVELKGGFKAQFDVYPHVWDFLLFPPGRPSLD
jgi:hypothetical protein